MVAPPAVGLAPGTLVTAPRCTAGRPQHTLLLRQPAPSRHPRPFGACAPTAGALLHSATTAPHTPACGAFRQKVRTAALADTMPAGVATLAAARGLPFPPYAPLAGSEAGSFADGTISKRLPAILTSMLADAEAVLGQAFAGDAAKQGQLREAVGAIAGMREDMTSNGQLTEVVAPPGDPQFKLIVQQTNDCVALWRARNNGDASWMGLPWLVVECYMYVRIHASFRSQPAIAALSFDPFQTQKQAAFTKSRASVVDLAAAMKALLQPCRDDAELREHLFEVTQYSLWGNKTDLSMLVDASKLPEGGLLPSAGTTKSGQAAPFLIVDEFDAVWAALQKHKGGRVDIVLDNAGLELYGDLLLADFLTTHGLASKVVFHGKPLPWFVSDTMRHDFDWTLQACTEAAPAGAADAAGWSEVQSLARRWQQHVAAGTWSYTDHTFWTTPLPFCWMEAVAPELHAELAQHSALVIFKGDLNYRKLSYDCRWPLTTPFSEALMGFHPAPLVTLRTLKADVMAGLREGEGQRLSQLDKDWMVNGKFGIIQAWVPPQQQ